MSEIVTNGVTGLHFTPGDPMILQKKCNGLGSILTLWLRWDIMPAKNMS